VDLRAVYGSEVETTNKTFPAIRLTPEVRERIKRIGVPLWSIVGGALVFDDDEESTGFAEGGNVKGAGRQLLPRTSLEYLRAAADTLANQVPFISEETRRGLSEDITRPLGGFASQWMAPDVEGNPATSSLPSMVISPLSGTLEHLLAQQMGQRRTLAPPGLVTETLGLPADLMDIYGLFSGAEEPADAPEISRLAQEQTARLREGMMRELALDEPSGFKEHALESLGIMAGQLPVGEIPAIATRIPKVAKAMLGPLSAAVEWFSPTVVPKLSNYAMGTGFGGALGTGVEMLGEREIEKFKDEVYDQFEAGLLSPEEAELILSSLEAELGKIEAPEETEESAYMSGRGFAKGGSISLRKLRARHPGKPLTASYPIDPSSAYEPLVLDEEGNLVDGWKRLGGLEKFAERHGLDPDKVKVRTRRYAKGGNVSKALRIMHDFVAHKDDPGFQEGQIDEEEILSQWGDILRHYGFDPQRASEFRRTLDPQHLDTDPEGYRWYRTELEGPQDLVESLARKIAEAFGMEVHQVHAKGGPIKPTLTALRQKLADLIAPPAAVQGTGKEMVPVAPRERVDPSTGEPLDVIPTLEALKRRVESEPTETVTSREELTGTVSRRDVLRGMKDIAGMALSPVDPMALIGSELENLGTAVKAAPVAAARTFNPTQLAGALQTISDNIFEGSEDSAEILAALAKEAAEAPQLAKVAPLLARAAELERKVAYDELDPESREYMEEGWDKLRPEINNALAEIAESQGLLHLPGHDPADFGQDAIDFEEATPARFAEPPVPNIRRDFDRLIEDIREGKYPDVDPSQADALTEWLDSFGSRLDAELARDFYPTDAITGAPGIRDEDYMRKFGVDPIIQDYIDDMLYEPFAELHPIEMDVDPLAVWAEADPDLRAEHREILTKLQEFDLPIKNLERRAEWEKLQERRNEIREQILKDHLPAEDEE
jgi:hypothetical protein